jgi:hypothetical protein
MTFLNGITHLTNWMGNVIMSTVAGLFFALAVVRYARGYPHQYIAWAGLMCLIVSGLLRGLETFASQSAWNNPDTIWITLRGLVNWTCNVFMPVYVVLQIVRGVLAYHRQFLATISVGSRRLGLLAIFTGALPFFLPKRLRPRTPPPVDHFTLAALFRKAFRVIDGLPLFARARCRFDRPESSAGIGKPQDEHLRA